MTNASAIESRKPLKVKLPVQQHIRLHALRLVTQEGISDTVERALEHYFRHLQSSGVLPQGVALDQAIVNFHDVVET